jgi:hypothetical protein
MTTLTVVHLVLVLLGTDGQTNTQVREFRNISDCKQAELAAHEAAKNASDFTDVGTILREVRIRSQHQAEGVMDPVTTTVVQQMCKSAEAQRQVAVGLLERGYPRQADIIAEAARLIELAARELLWSIEAYERAVLGDPEAAR